MASAEQIASPAVYVTADIGLEVTDGVSSRVQLGQLSGADYGLRVVSADGTTVIIDGTSDVFKISATGTLTVTVAAAGPANKTTGTSAVVLTGLGTQATQPSHLSLVSDTNTTTGARNDGGRIQYWGPQVFWAATASGGAVTSAFLAPADQADMYTNLDGSSLANVTLSAQNADVGSGRTFYGRYYVLTESAL